MGVTLAQIELALRTSWSAETQHAREDWLSAGGPSRGQCGPTSLVLQTLLGGDLVCAPVRIGAERVGVHYWNRFPGGVDVDLTADQFLPGEVVGDPEVVIVPPEGPRHGLEAYELLRRRVYRRLGLPADGVPPDSA